MPTKERIPESTTNQSEVAKAKSAERLRATAARLGERYAAQQDVAKEVAEVIANSLSTADAAKMKGLIKGGVSGDVVFAYLVKSL